MVEALGRGRARQEVDQMLAEPLLADDQGYVTVPDRPGFGFELDHEAIERHSVPFPG